VPDIPVDLTIYQAGLIALAAAGTALLALLLALLAQLRLSRLRRGLRASRGPAGDVPPSAPRPGGDSGGLREHVARLQEELERVRADLAFAVRHVAVVRFDAFGDNGGRMSFSAALLDDSGDGVLLTSINGRGETRTYGKAVTAGRSDTTLTPEEEQAVAAAR
jgi:hypothetical protein